ncbi:hypothetical protein CHLNCDRAFT_143928 [Chlorella variabilis]|uniref:RRM domain-containing protein n=1 Tax=Chlorella variabilis TaxID=554065 RepID=E1ZAR8_CHLVA|nr:hypothetical protein CHLNCDRAFT_143928 [Chlorella variabilis]EFN57106.1 hypothetical protein CHLNCDRAFT_143928 [Chlorella variabilis]|eukprot:XP_005849208.1 hypothetical protein CHLNCDRAFT_143928 [Chlorella variabilis]
MSEGDARAVPPAEEQPPMVADGQQADLDKRARSKSKERRRSRSRDRKERRRSRSRDRRRSRDKDRRRRSRSRDRGSRRSRSRDRRRRSRSRSRGDPGYGYQGRVGRGRDIDPTINFHDPFAALRSANQATDPTEIARQMQEQQLRARQLVLQQQAASAVAAASKTQREVYVGNLTAGLVTADMLKQLFNSTMAAAFPDMAKPGYDPVVNVSVHTEGRYAFVELRTADMASASLQLNGQVQLLGATLSIGRPSGYVDPGKAAAAATVAAEALAKFQAESQALRRQNGQLTDEQMKDEETNYIQIEGMITADVLADDQEYADVLADIHEECSKHGTVLRVVVPRPPVPADAAALMGTGSYGRAYVQFLDLEGSKQARAAIHGRMFAGSTVQAVFMQPQEFMDAIAPPPAPLPDLAAALPGAVPGVLGVPVVPGVLGVPMMPAVVPAEDSAVPPVV